MMDGYFKPKERNISERDGLKLTLGTHGNGLHWIYENKSGDTLSIILNEGSYGGGNGLFEISPSWREPCEYDSVLGHLTFGDVQKWIDELKEIHLKKLTRTQEIFGEDC